MEANGRSKAAEPGVVGRRRFLSVASAGTVGMIAGKAGAAGAAEAETRQLRVDLNAVIQPRFRGWGTSLAWWAHVAGRFPDDLRGELMGKVFGRGDGLGLNIVRYNIGGGEQPGITHLASRAAVPGFQPVEGKWDWGADVYQRRILKECRELGVDFVEAFGNSPPWWMTKSGSVTGDEDGRGNLREERVGDYAEYLARVVWYFREKEGMEFQTLAPMNEPLGTWWRLGKHQEGCVVPPEQQSRLVVATREALDRYGLRTAVTGPEGNRISHTMRALRGYRGEAWNALGHVNTHTYHADGSEALRELVEKKEKRLWVSEYGDGDSSGMRLAARIIADLRVLRPEAWVYWQAMDNGGWGLLSHPQFSNMKREIRAHEHGAHELRAKYHVMRQFTSHLRPGCRLVDSSLENSVAAFDPRKREMSLLVLNPAESVQQLTFTLAGAVLKGKTLQATLVDAEGKVVSGPPVGCEEDSEQIGVPARSLLAVRVTG